MTTAVGEKDTTTALDDSAGENSSTQQSSRQMEELSFGEQVFDPNNGGTEVVYADLKNYYKEVTTKDANNNEVTWTLNEDTGLFESTNSSGNVVATAIVNNQNQFIILQSQVSPPDGSSTAHNYAVGTNNIVYQEADNGDWVAVGYVDPSTGVITIDNQNADVEPGTQMILNPDGKLVVLETAPDSVRKENQETSQSFALGSDGVMYRREGGTSEWEKVGETDPTTGITTITSDRGTGGVDEGQEVLPDPVTGQLVELAPADPNNPNVRESADGKTTFVQVADGTWAANFGPPDGSSTTHNYALGSDGTLYQESKLQPGKWVAVGSSDPTTGVVTVTHDNANIEKGTQMILDSSSGELVVLEGEPNTIENTGTDHNYVVGANGTVYQLSQYQESERDNGKWMPVGQRDSSGIITMDNPNAPQVEGKELLQDETGRLVVLAPADPNNPNVRESADGETTFTKGSDGTWTSSSSGSSTTAESEETATDETVAEETATEEAAAEEAAADEIVTEETATEETTTVDEIKAAFEKEGLTWILEELALTDEQILMIDDVLYSINTVIETMRVLVLHAGATRDSLKDFVTGLITQAEALQTNMNSPELSTLVNNRDDEEES